MTVRAFECRAPGTGQVLGYVALTRVEELTPGTRIVRLRFGTDWRCALLDRSRIVEVEGMLLRDAVASDEQDCPEGAAQLSAESARAAPGAPIGDAPPAVQAAVVTRQGVPLVVVLVRRELIDSPGEASMFAADLSPRFGGAAVVLLGQDDDGTPHFHGDPALLGLLQGLALESMPWKGYPSG